MRVDTHGYKGAIQKTARVFTNDPIHKMEYLTLKAFIKVAITLSKDRVILKGTPGETVTDVVELRAEREKALLIDPVYYDLDQKVSYDIETVEEGRSYRIHFKNKPVPPGNFHGFLRLKTNYEEKPLVLIRIRGRFNK